MDRLRSIQILRALAALSVVYFHARSREMDVFGAAGVDLFFVISGFIITKIADGRTPMQFLAARAWRVYPLYFACLGIFMLLVTVPPSPCKIVASATLLPIGCGSYLTPAWSLAFELLFYALATMSIGRPKLIFPLVVAVALFFPPIVEPSRSAGNLIMLEFLAGAAIAYLPRAKRAGWVLALGLGALLIAPPDLSPSVWRVVIWGIPSALVVYGALSLDRHFASSKWDWLVKLGDASYSIYLVHFILHRALPMPWAMEVPVQALAGYLTHLWVERPIMRLRKRGSRPTEPLSSPALPASSSEPA